MKISRYKKVLWTASLVLCIINFTYYFVPNFEHMIVALVNNITFFNPVVDPSKIVDYVDL